MTWEPIPLEGTCPIFVGITWLARRTDVSGIVATVSVAELDMRNIAFRAPFAANSWPVKGVAFNESMTRTLLYR